MGLKENNDNIFSSLSKIYRDPLFILIIITAGITFYLLKVQMKIGVPYFDVFTYLNNALYFAGMGNEGYLYLPPLIPILTSLFFRMGYVSQNVIFIIDSLIFIIGVIGFYLLLKERFNSIQSLTGSLIFLSLSVVMPWIAAGGIDIPGVSFSIWAIYLTILGVKKNSKFLYLVLPLIMLAFLTRYTAGLIIIPILLYSIINLKEIIKNKKVILGILLEFIPIITALVFFYIKLGAFTAFYTLFIVSTTTSAGTTDVAYNPNILYYLQNILNYISVAPFQGTYLQILNPSKGIPSLISYIIALIAVTGLIFYIYKVLYSRIGKIRELKVSSFNTIKIALLIILIVGFLMAFNSLNLIISEIIFFGICYLIYILLKNHETSIDIDLMFFSWFGVYLIFQSILNIKVDRYFITMAPAFVYFLILGLSEVIDIIKPKIKNEDLKSWGIYSVIALIFLSSATATYIGHTPKKCFTVDIEDASGWLKEYDPNYKDKIIYSDYPPAASWYFKYKIKEISPESFNSSKELSDFLQKNNVDYYIDSISRPKPDIDNYQIIKNIDSVVIYKRIK